MTIRVACSPSRVRHLVLRPAQQHTHGQLQLRL